MEIKAESVTEDATGGIEARAVAEVRRAGMADAVALISFDQRAILRLAQLAPEITPRPHLRPHDGRRGARGGPRRRGCELVMPHKGQLTDALVARVHAAGLKLATWVVDEPAELRALARFGLYGVGSNRPGVLLEAIADGLLGLDAEPRTASRDPPAACPPEGPGRSLSFRGTAG